MSYKDVLENLIYGKAAQRLYTPIPNDHVSPSIPAGEFEPDGCYLRVWLSDMYLAHKRELWRTCSPAVHLTCRFQYAGAVQELPLIIGPGQNKDLKSPRPCGQPELLPLWTRPVPGW